jgi:hypothetical protein
MKEIDISLIPLSKKEAKAFPFKVGDDVIISSSDIFFEGLRSQYAVVVAVGRGPSDMKVCRVVAGQHTVPNYPQDFEWEIVPELLEKYERKEWNLIGR